MDYCTTYFGKSLNQLSYDDITNYFIEQRLETATIEFKSFAKGVAFEQSFKKVIRGINSFLNSDGGIMIWGAPQAKKLTQTKEDIFEGDLCPVTELRSKDWLINRIGNEITPIPTGINIRILSKNKEHVYIFEVQESIAKPHQYEFRYYIRLDGQSRPAPHYVVDALMKRITFPNLCGVVRFYDIKPDIQVPQFFHIPISIGIFNFSELQNEEFVSFRLLCVGGYFPAGKAFLKINLNPRYSHDGSELIYENFANVLHFGTPVTHDNEIVVTPSTLKEAGGQLQLLLSFGGKKSPAKMSRYTFNITILPGFYCELVDLEENILFADNTKRINKTMQDSLKAFTGR